MARQGEVKRKWHVVDAQGANLGRLATEVALVLRGKRKAQYTPHVDTGDFVVVVNAQKVQVTGRKAEQKLYRRHTGYPGGLKEMTYEEMQQKKPEEIIKKAVKGMMPRTRLGRQQLKKLKVYAGPEHPHKAQDPQALETEVR